MKERTLFARLALTATAVLLVAAGCGGSSSDNGTNAGTGGTAVKQEITVNWGAEPPSLDPGLATDTTSSNILLNIMDPLVRLGPPPNLEPVPALAESWDTSEDGLTVTFHLRSDGKWTNGDPVTAGDFEYAWKRTVSPELAADYSYQFFGIVGAAEYNSCTKNCDALADKVGVKAVDDTTLEVTLTSPQPWFVQQAAHHSFLAVNKKVVDQFGDKWTEAKNIVTNGPFKLAAWQHNANIDLVKNEQWRDAASVTLTSVKGRMITDGITGIQAFEAGEIDVNINTPPPDEIARIKETPEYQQYPALGTYYYGFNVKKITDVHQRRAMTLAVDHRTIIDQIAQADQLPPTGFTPKGMPGFDDLNPNSEWLPENGDIEKAKAEMAQVANPVTDVQLFYNNAPGHKEIAVAIQSMWKELGINTTIKQQEWAQFLEFLGPPPNDVVDVYRLGWIGDYVDAINFLELWTCDSGNNNTNFCDQNYDALIDEARKTPDNTARYAIYKQAEEILFGPDGQVPMLPIYWYTYTSQEATNVQETFNINLLDQIDLSVVKVEG